jgi:hypothetical protein
MKITYRGKPESERTWRGECRDCNSRATAKQSEMTNITHDQRECGLFSWEPCPVCKGRMIFYPTGSGQYR